MRDSWCFGEDTDQTEGKSGWVICVRDGDFVGGDAYTQGGGLMFTSRYGEPAR